MNLIKTNAAPAAVGPYSQAVQHQSLIFVSGQLPIDPLTGAFVPGDIKDMTRQCMKNLQAVLEAAGSRLEQIVKTTIYVTDLSKFSLVNEAYGEFFSEHLPARACLQVAALPKGAEVEIEAIASC